MNKDFKKYEIISLIFYANALSWLFFWGTSERKLAIFGHTWPLNGILTLIGLVFFAVKAICQLDIPKWKKVLFIIAQLVAYFIIYVICSVIYLLFFTADISLIV